MTQHDLARATGMPQPSIARIETGTVTPRTATLIEILSATGHQLAVEPIDSAVDRDAIRKQLAMGVPKRTPKTGRILQRLRRFGVPFVLVGELAEAAQGSPVKVGRMIEVCVASTDVAQDRLRLALDDHAPIHDASRLRILARLYEGPASVSEICEAVAMDGSAVSHQLRILRHLGLVVGERDGRRVNYSLHDEHVGQLMEQAMSHVEHLRIGLSDHAHREQPAPA